MIFFSSTKKQINSTKWFCVRLQIIYPLYFLCKSNTLNKNVFFIVFHNFSLFLSLSIFLLIYHFSIKKNNMTENTISLFDIMKEEQSKIKTKKNKNSNCSLILTNYCTREAIPKEEERSRYVACSIPGFCLLYEFLLMILFFHRNGSWFIACHATPRRVWPRGPCYWNSE